jgi:hypothetical protein
VCIVFKIFRWPSTKQLINKLILKMLIFSKQVTDESKTAVMHVIGFLCVSLGSSTVQFHESLRSRRTCLCSEAGFSSQNGDYV